MPTNKGKKFPPEPLTVAECRALLRHCGRGATGARNRAIIAVLWRCGLRAAELVALEGKDVDVRRRTIRVLHGKGDKSRVVAVCPETLSLMREWAAMREGFLLSGAPSKRARFFCTLAGRPLETGYLRHLLPRLGRRAGIEKRVHPHGLRHTYARELAEEGKPLPVIQAALGHDHAHTTSTYLGKLGDPKVIAALQDRPRFELVSVAGGRQGVLPLSEAHTTSTESPEPSRPSTPPPSGGRVEGLGVLALALWPKVPSRARR